LSKQQQQQLLLLRLAGLLLTPLLLLEWLRLLVLLQEAAGKLRLSRLLLMTRAELHGAQTRGC
jgi:hypothetical protein